MCFTCLSRVRVARLRYWRAAPTRRATPIDLTHSRACLPDSRGRMTRSHVTAAVFQTQVLFCFTFTSDVVERKSTVL